MQEFNCIISSQSSGPDESFLIVTALVKATLKDNILFTNFLGEGESEGGREGGRERERESSKNTLLPPLLPHTSPTVFYKLGNLEAAPS